MRIIQSPNDHGVAKELGLKFPESPEPIVNSQPLPPLPEEETKSELPARIDAVFILPNDHKPIIESAREIFEQIAPTHTLFIRGRTVVELIEASDAFSLELMQPS